MRAMTVVPLVAVLAISAAGAARAQVPAPVVTELNAVCEAIGGCSICDSNLSTCESELSSCEATSQKFPATGQTTKYAAGDDGDLRKGAALSYTDNGDGTITDNNTKLMWEAKTGCGSGRSGTNLHAGDNFYPWAGSCSVGGAFCGTDADCSSGTCNASDSQGTGYTIFKWVAALNAANFAGHNDWRIPNKRELESIFDIQTLNPSVASAFNSGASSCTQSYGYWSSSTVATAPQYVWVVDFYYGGVYFGYRTGSNYVRAVRGGS
jgi:hypothetical protein